ncbi:hemin-degrading factor [Providencia hangzhouensis]|uniref:ChuX/HutX family heme-like substrate-binding protein n=2 Tax=Providencia TaxID=586 RepID=A0AAJ4TK43_PRORE|nr:MULTISPECIES: ChuX/HutX family heme-like substrate-binding protein [Providencia]MCF8964677.1 Hemin transport protein HemS [Providencia rettgeri]MDK7745156.1 ChuX/HutX family heme-like substrate-binding protein [Providencia rettgeri]MDK7757762.1 ChuX/HutX family heme-like substrate-binding protein [Providencia rettgeri]QWQ18759.2 ChuX/HutX family heme-like substrate-binding protein [Providencia rettgeri]QWQ22595.2 ChuX/HutX family heme-like substrate-binding protein [Providencia rettgeri]
MNSALYERYQQAKTENKAKYARDLAAYLNVSEAQLLHSRVGHDKAVRLNVDAPTLLTELATVGKVKAITRNEYVVHEQVGRYDNATFSPHGGLILNPRALDLRMFFSHWDAIFALTEDSKHGERHSIQFFDKQGDALHKVYTTDETDMAAWQALIEKYATQDNPELIHEAATPFTNQPVSEELKQQLEQQWRNMTDVHQFFVLLKKNNLSRQQVFAAVSDDLAWKVPNDSFNQLINTAFKDQNEIMIFVGNRGCVQIFTGEIKKIMPYQSEGSDLKWLNIFNPDFTLHMIENGIAECWVTRKPTQDGHVTSLEVFDNQGNQIAQMYGQRTEGTPEQEQWRQQVTALPRI